ncbi:hypothetical protein Esti_000533 [Eimeria stiedai]
MLHHSLPSKFPHLLAWDIPENMNKVKRSFYDITKRRAPKTHRLEKQLTGKPWELKSEVRVPIRVRALFLAKAAFVFLSMPWVNNIMSVLPNLFKKATLLNSPAAERNLGLPAGATYEQLHHRLAQVAEEDARQHQDGRLAKKRRHRWCPLEGIKKITAAFVPQEEEKNAKRRARSPPASQH